MDGRLITEMRTAAGIGGGDPNSWPGRMLGS